MSRRLIIVDVESSGLDSKHVPLEIAAVNFETGEQFLMVPHIIPQDLTQAEPAALQINRYYERGVWKDQMDSDTTKNAYNWLADMLRDNTLGGSNPSFDAGMIAPHTGTVWHHRLADLSAYAAGVLGIPATELPGLHVVCDILGVVNQEPHSALGDALATAECFKLLFERATR